MRRQTLLCLKSLGACSALWAAGCGTHQSPALSSPDAIPAPRTINLPANIRPLLKAEPRQNDEADGGPIPAQYEQPQPPPSARPRITGVSTTSSPILGSVRDSYWGNPRAAASSSTMPRGDYLPLAPPRQNSNQSNLNQAISNQPTKNASPAPAAAVSLPPPPSENASAVLPQAVSVSAPPAIVANPSAPTASPQPSIYGPQLTAPNIGYPSSPPSPPSQPVSFDPAQPQPPQFQASPAAPQRPPVMSNQPTVAAQAAGMQAVAQQAMQMADQAASMAQRGMLFSANTQLVKGLTLVSQALDVQQGTAAHSAALTAGLTALAEARDFTSAGDHKGGATEISAIAATHQTKLPIPIAPGTSPVVAQQQYFGFAQQQLAIAGGGIKASSEILYRLGRLQTAMAAHDSDPAALHGPQAIVFHQAALATDANNWLAANELGVLYARYGQLPQARQLLVQSVTIHAHRQGWQNLAVVHRRLGEIDLAQRAEAEVQLIDKQPGQDATANDIVRWVDPKTFAASGSAEASWPVNVASKTTATTSGPTRR